MLFMVGRLAAPARVRPQIEDANANAEADDWIFQYGVGCEIEQA
jgi:hypothetical protein